MCSGVQSGDEGDDILVDACLLQTFKEDVPLDIGEGSAKIEEEHPSCLAFHLVEVSQEPYHLHVCVSSSTKAKLFILYFLFNFGLNLIENDSFNQLGDDWEYRDLANFINWREVGISLRDEEEIAGVHVAAPFFGFH